MPRKRRNKQVIAYVSDDLNKMKSVDAGDKVQFQCTRCGECCRHVKDGVMLETLDVFRLAQHLHQAGDIEGIEDVLNDYAHPLNIVEGVTFPIFLLNTKGKDDACVFLKDNRCIAQNAKPKTCRLYPFGATPDDNGGYDFSIVSQKPHHFRGRTVNVGDWMDTNFTEEDRAFMAADMCELQRIIPYINAQSAAGNDDFVLKMVMFFRYINYVLAEPFMPQFERNMASLYTALSKGVRACG